MVSETGETPTARATEGRVAGERVVFDVSGALYLPDAATLVVSDLHLEKGSAFARRGQMLPPYDTVTTLQRLDGLIGIYAPRAVVSLGDSFHDGWGAARLAPEMRAMLEAMMLGRDWYWIAGNHDPEPPAGLPGETVGGVSIGSLVFRHHPSRGPASGEVAGHLHPGARIVRRGRSVRRACFAGDSERLIMPAFGAFTGTLNVLDAAFRGMFCPRGFRAHVLGAERIYSLGGAQLAPG